MDRYRSLSHMQRPSVKAYEVTDIDWLMKYHFFHRDRDESIVLRIADGLDSTRNVDVAENDSAKDGAVCIRVARHHRQTNCCIAGNRFLFFHSCTFGISYK